MSSKLPTDDSLYENKRQRHESKPRDKSRPQIQSSHDRLVTRTTSHSLKNDAETRNLGDDGENESQLRDLDLQEKQLIELMRSKKRHEQVLHELRMRELQEIQELELVKKEKRRQRAKLEKSGKVDRHSTRNLIVGGHSSRTKIYEKSTLPVVSEIDKPLPVLRFEGLSGATGFYRKAGLDGATGLQGATGWQGETGFGLQGATGPEGGPIGATGFQGATGPEGGPIGATGLQGPTGSMGATGPISALGSGLIYFSTNNSALCLSRYIGQGCDAEDHQQGFTDVSVVVPADGYIVSYVVSSKGYVQPNTVGPKLALALRSGHEGANISPIDIGHTQLSPNGGITLPHDSSKQIIFSPPYRVNAFDCLALHVLDPMGWSNFELSAVAVFQAL